MKKSVVTFGILTIFAMALAGCFRQDVPSQVIEESKESVVEKDSSSRYLVFTPELFNSTAQSRRILFFYANWCPTCIPADTSFRDNESQIPEDVRLIRVNYNDTETDQAEKDLAKKYAVTYQHTFVEIDTEGNAVNTWNGGKIEELLSKLK